MIPRLVLHRFSYSSALWRLAWQSAADVWREIVVPGCWWNRKRDGQPTLVALQALALAWSPEAIAAWTPAHHTAVRAILGPLVHAEAEHVRSLSGRAPGR